MLNQQSPQSLPHFEESIQYLEHADIGGKGVEEGRGGKGVGKGVGGCERERGRAHAVNQLLCPHKSNVHMCQPNSLANNTGHYHLHLRLRQIFICLMESF